MDKSKGDLVERLIAPKKKKKPLSCHKLQDTDSLLTSWGSIESEDLLYKNDSEMHEHRTQKENPIEKKIRSPPLSISKKTALSVNQSHAT